MSHTHSTENYNLPQFIGTDIPDWLTDVNKGYSDIDAGMQANKVSANTANEKADNNTTSIRLLNERVDNLSKDINGAETGLSNLEQTVELHTTHLNEIDVTTTNQSNDIAELQTTQTEQGQDIVSIKTDSDKVPGLQENLNTLSATVAEHSTLLTEAQKDIELLESRVGSVENTLATSSDIYVEFETTDGVDPLEVHISSQEALSIVRYTTMTFKQKKDDKVVYQKIDVEYDINGQASPVRIDSIVAPNPFQPASDIATASVFVKEDTDTAQVYSWAGVLGRNVSDEFELMGSDSITVSVNTTATMHVTLETTFI